MPSTPATVERIQPEPDRAILEIRDLTTVFGTPDGNVRAVDRVSLDVRAGEALGIVGESGSGKTQLFLSVMGLLAQNGKASGSVRLDGGEILNLPAQKLNRIRGARMAMVFQDPLTSLNPYLTVRRQMTEVLVIHQGMSETEARRHAIDMLARVQIPRAAERIDLYPHEFSGGMRQRVMLAMALLCRPALLILDEPTTALDVTVQAQILALVRELRNAHETAIVLISHDLGVIAGTCDRVAVMYAGRIVEEAPVRELFYRPQHPYSLGLLRSTPRLDVVGGERLPTVPGQPPDLLRVPPGCPFAPRCSYKFERCEIEEPLLRPVGDAHRKACHLEKL
jgi:oligopeptide transport system ATP-binding protein